MEHAATPTSPATPPTAAADTSAPDPASRPTRAFRRIVHVRRAFGTPIDRDGLTLVPVARVTGGTGFGGGSGVEDDGESGTRGGSGSGGGIGVHVAPVGVYVVKDGEVRWEPAIDAGRIVVTGEIVGAIAVLALAWALRRRRCR